MGGGQSKSTQLVTGEQQAMMVLKDYFSTQAKEAPVSMKSLELAKKVLKNKIKLTESKEDYYYDLTEGVDLDDLERYADDHTQRMGLKDDTNRKMMKEKILMIRIVKENHCKWENVIFSDNKFFHYKGFIYMYREPDNKITVGYCIVNIFMEIECSYFWSSVLVFNHQPWPQKAEDGLTFREIQLIKETYLYYKALEQLKKQNMIDEIPMVA